jgi:polysaccharide export outer membrane protein
MYMRVLLALLFLCSGLTSAFAQLEPLHPGDALQITVWQDPKLDRKIVVGPDGMIAFPLAGHVKAGGMTTKMLEDALKSRLQKNYSGELDITVTLADVNKDAEIESKPRFYVTGEVQKPGPYVLRPQTDVVQALAQAGGLGVFAAAQRIQIHRKVRGTDSIFLFDYNSYQTGTIATDNINLRSGDIIIVPERGLFE